MRRKRLIKIAVKEPGVHPPVSPAAASPIPEFTWVAAPGIVDWLGYVPGIQYVLGLR